MKKKKGMPRANLSKMDKTGHMKGRYHMGKPNLAPQTQSVVPANAADKSLAKMRGY